MSHVSDIEDALSIVESAVSERASRSSYRTWTIPKMIAELDKRGIRLSATARKAELYHLLFPEPSTGSTEQIPMSTIQLSLTQLHATINNLSSSICDMNTRLQAVESRDASPAAPSSPAPGPSTSQPSSSGHASSRQNRDSTPGLRLSDPGLDRHLVMAHTLIRKSLSENSTRNYQSGWKAFEVFRHLHPRGNVSETAFIMAFLAYCHKDLHLSFSTIRSYLSGVQHHLMIRQPDSNPIFSSHAIKATLRGIQKCSHKSGPARQPVSGDLFRKLSSSLDGSPFGPFRSCILKAALYLSFYGFLRPGEFTGTSPHNSGPALNQLTRSRERFTFTLPVSKTSQIGPPVHIGYFPTSNSWCPVAVLNGLLTTLGNRAPASPLLPFPSRPLTSSQFVKHIRSLASGFGFNPQAITGHSFRIGAASAASKHGVPAHIIRKMGRWKSSCFSRYIPHPKAEIAAAFSDLVL
ncbi:uncharacterized protein LOC120991027 [Bufo bufo]|uniref:uncharacterized protein LOC120991027 n=1 Tax=Bufo bufo TaxID=8384 RepID=UPI001ABDC750|nr:uncharacterized protein LOC120991027 [Bufo bufo]